MNTNDNKTPITPSDRSPLDSDAENNLNQHQEEQQKHEEKKLNTDNEKEKELEDDSKEKYNRPAVEKPKEEEPIRDNVIIIEDNPLEKKPRPFTDDLSSEEKEQESNNASELDEQQNPEKSRITGL